MIGIGQRGSVGNPVTFTNAGTGVLDVRGEGREDACGSHLDGSASRLVNDGRITVTNPVGGAIGSWSAVADLRLVDAGLIEALGGATAIGIDVEVNVYLKFDADDRIANAGRIVAQADQAWGILALQRTIMTNSGSIVAQGASQAIAVELRYNGLLDNSGTILATVSDPSGLSIGISVYNAASFGPPRAASRPTATAARSRPTSRSSV